LESASHAQWTVREDDVIRSQLEPLGERETIGAMLIRNATLLAEHAAYAERRHADFRKVSWSELRRDVCAFGAFLTTSGVQPGDRVAVVSPNRGAMLTVELATMCLGAIYVPIFAGYSATQTTTLLAHAPSRARRANGRASSSSNAPSAGTPTPHA
jgi:long-chain acyl-CoA synthetase